MATLEVLGVGATQYGGTPPAAPAGPFFVQFGTAAVPFGGGLSPAVPFPRAFPKGLIAIVLMLAYGAPSQLAVTLSGATNEFFSMCAAAGSSPWDTGGSLVDVEWEAYGW